MKTIKSLYEELDYDKTIFFQATNKKQLAKIIEELNNIFDNFDEVNTDYVKLNNTWFILGNWRNGMFKLTMFKYWDNWEEQEVYILADTKESPLNCSNHIDQIYKIIDVLDKYRNYIKQKKVKYDDDFNIVKIV